MESEDYYIGRSRIIKRLRKIGKRVRGAARRIKKRIQSARGGAADVAAVARDEVARVRAAVAPVQQVESGAFDFGQWARENPAILAAVGLGAVILFVKKK